VQKATAAEAAKVTAEKAVAAAAAEATYLSRQIEGAHHAAAFAAAREDKLQVLFYIFIHTSIHTGIYSPEFTPIFTTVCMYRGRSREHTKLPLLQLLGKTTCRWPVNMYSHWYSQTVYIYKGDRYSHACMHIFTTVCKCAQLDTGRGG